ncbi:Xyloside transporter XynT [Citrobacter freundii]|uniref:Xyloside transporter XynT n=1 Tax=Citrobacter freundii TaxID=546 RepID=A0A7G2IY69_CITFR|nr:Xyloside transporter XynT [Citrobacter freundii]
MREDLRDIWQNDQWRIVGMLTILNILAVCVRGGAMMYYVTWILGTPEVFVAFLTTYCVGNLIGSALAKPLTDWKCKVSVFWWTNAALAVVSLAMFFVPMHANITMFVFIFVIGVLHQLVTPIQWVMMSDTVDYGEWCNGKTSDGDQLCRHVVRAQAGSGARRGADRLDAGGRGLRRRSENPEQRHH